MCIFFLDIVPLYTYLDYNIVYAQLVYALRNQNTQVTLLQYYFPYSDGLEPNPLYHWGVPVFPQPADLSYPITCNI